MVDAIVTAGGKGTRIKELGIEKPMIEVLGKPIIERVLETLSEAETIRNAYVSISENTSITKDFVEHLGFDTVFTTGEDYVKDLRASMKSPSSRAVFVCPADLPLMTDRSVDQVVSYYESVNVPSLAVVVPSRYMHSLGLDATFEMTVDGCQVVLCGVSVVDRRLMILGEYLEEDYFVSEIMDFALNVNSMKELRMAERILERRAHS